MNTDAQSAGPPELRAPTKAPTVKPQYSTINSRSRSHARGLLGLLGLASLFACCFVPLSLRGFGIRVATLLTGAGRCSQQCTGAGRCLLLVAAHRIVRGSASFGRAVRGPATRRCLRLAGAHCSSRAIVPEAGSAAVPSLWSSDAVAAGEEQLGRCTAGQSKSSHNYLRK
jgi:hypothetical protein